jgi:hypothetical protein
MITSKALAFFSVALAGYLLMPVLATAQTGQQQSRRFAPGTCGPVDSTYIHLAEKSGGQPMFLRPEEMAAAGHLMRSTTSSNSDTALWVADNLSGEREFLIPLDSTIKRATFSLSFNTPGTLMTLRQPSGAAVNSGEPGIELSDWTCGRIVSATRPAAGIWKVQLQGSGRFWLRVITDSALFFVSVEFVRLGGRPGHQGLSRIPGQPLLGRPETLEVNLSGLLKKADFRLVSPSGETIQHVRMEEQGADREDHEFVGTLLLPPQPFRLAVSGLDAAGASFERMYSTEFQATSIELIPTLHDEEVRAGAASPVEFLVKNHGTADTFRVLAVDSLGSIVPSEPGELALPPGASARLKVLLSVPASTPAGKSVTLTVTVTGTANPAAVNYAIVELAVAAH